MSRKLATLGDFNKDKDDDKDKKKSSSNNSKPAPNTYYAGTYLFCVEQCPIFWSVMSFSKNTLPVDQ
jgi:hypothetical protein